MKYNYTPLLIQPEDPRHVLCIRLLHLLPTTDRDAKLECQLIETHVPNPQSGRTHGSTHVQYQALSYSWGEPEFSKSLYVLRGPGEDVAGHASLIGVLNITENLHSALFNLRRPNKTLVLWVDAVCINQANILERNSQVGSMPQIYNAATSVLVWLGTDDLQLNGRLCLNFFTDLATLIVGDRDGGPQVSGASWRKRLKINRIVSAFLDSAQPRPIASFLARSWFKRRWIIQEVVLAKDVSVHCGETSIHWSTFELALTELFENDRGGFSDEHRTALRTMSRIRNVDAGAKSQVPLDTLIDFETFACADPRDRLYALYGVIQHWFPGTAGKEARLGNVDYALSVGDVFTNFAILMMELNDKLPPDMLYDPVTHVLQLAAAIQEPTSRVEGLVSREDCEKIPSWVPDWTGTLTSAPLNHSPTDRDASFGIPKRQIEILTSNHDVRLLISIGLVYDIVTANISLDIEPLSGPVHEAKATFNDFLCLVAESFDDTGFFNSVDIDTYPPTGEHIINAVATTLIANWEHTPVNSYFAQHHRFLGDFLEQLESSKHHLCEILHKWPAYVELVSITMRGRGLFLTQSGYIGVCASNVQPGDVVCILSDMKIPFILRPKGVVAVPTKDGLPHIPGCYPFRNEKQLREIVSVVETKLSAHCTFQSMGDAYVHGLMNGEAAKRLSWQLHDSLTILPIA